MRKMFFLTCWPSGRETAWSGTPNGLYQALSKKLSLSEVDVSVRRRGPLAKAGKVWNDLCVQLPNVRAAERMLDRNPDVRSGTPVLAFAEYRSKAVRDTYCYQDLSADFLLYDFQKKHDRRLSAQNAFYKHMLAKKVARADGFYRDCRGVFTMSEWLREDMVQRSGLPAEKVHHVGGGCSVDVSKIDPSRKQGNRFLFVGKLWELKNGPLVVEAFEKLKELCPEYEAELYIAGPSEKPGCLEGKQGITYLGVLSYEELASWYNLCDYFVMPSKRDAYGLVFAEALTFGLPCIGKNCFAMPEFIQDGKNGFLIEKDDADELADAMKRLLVSGRPIAQAVQAERGKYLEKYSWDSVADRIIQVLEADGY